MSDEPDPDISDEELRHQLALEYCYRRNKLRERIDDLTNLVNKAMVVSCPYLRNEKIAEVLVRMQKHIARVGKCFEWDDDNAARKTCAQLGGAVKELKSLLKGIGVPFVENLFQ